MRTCLRCNCEMIEHIYLTDYRFKEIINKIISKVCNKSIEELIDPFDIYEENELDLFDLWGENATIHFGTIGGYANFTQNDPITYLAEKKINVC